MAYHLDLSAVAAALKALSPGLRAQLELKLATVARFAELTPPPSSSFLRREGIDPETVFRFEVGGYWVRYEVEPEAKLLRVVQVALHPTRDQAAR
jgi:mRNA-degrading endonuclease RelE of RelBE toxin-antitoxin system